MGYIRHHAIAVTMWDDKMAKKLHKKAKELFGHLVTKIIDSGMNSTVSFFIAPDGSKEGWGDSDKGDKNRAEFIAYCKTFEYKPRFCEFFYGDDEGQAQIIQHN